MQSNGVEGGISTKQNTTSPILTSEDSVFNHSNIVNLNNSEFASLGKEKGDNFAPQLIGAVIGGGVNLYTQYKRDGDSFNNIDLVELGLNTLTGAWSGGASAIGSAVVRGGLAAGTNESYNQGVNEKNTLKEKSVEVGKALVYGGGTGSIIGITGNIGKNIIIKTGVINKPANTPLKTLKTPLESVTGILSGITSNIKDEDK
ncbi:MAG: hypothetical protein GY932_15595 [Arcobacter sp.]|nr:hypothetical protein [Arcobacter sp.]